MAMSKIRSYTYMTALIAPKLLGNKFKNCLHYVMQKTVQFMMMKTLILIGSKVEKSM